MPLFADEVNIASGVGGSLQHIHEAASGDGRHGLYASGFKERGREIADVDEIVHHAPGGNVLAPADSERNVEAVLVDLAFHAGEGLAVIGGNHHKRVVEFAGLLQLLQRQAQVLVKPLHFQGIVEHVAAHNTVVWQIGRHVDAGRIAAGTQAGAFFIDAVRLLAT